MWLIPYISPLPDVAPRIDLQKWGDTSALERPLDDVRRCLLCLGIVCLLALPSEMAALPIQLDALVGTYSPGDSGRRSALLTTPSNTVAFRLRIDFYSPGSWQLEVRFPGLVADPISAAGPPAVVWIKPIPDPIPAPGEQFAIELEFLSIGLPVDVWHVEVAFITPEASMTTMLALCLLGMVHRRRLACGLQPTTGRQRSW